MLIEKNESIKGYVVVALDLIEVARIWRALVRYAETAEGCIGSVEQVRDDFEKLAETMKLK